MWQRYMVSGITMCMLLGFAKSSIVSSIEVPGTVELILLFFKPCFYLFRL